MRQKTSKALVYAIVICAIFLTFCFVYIKTGTI